MKPILPALSLALFSLPLSAGTLSGDTVNVQHRYAGNYENLVTQVVPTSSFTYPGGFYSLLVAEDTITLNKFAPTPSVATGQPVISMTP